jgi:Leucine-rich repeat (LRR) protein
MHAKRVKAHIRAAFELGLGEQVPLELDLGRQRLTILPPEIGQLTRLERLYLKDNQLTALPPEIGQLTALTELDVSNNQLTSLPPEIGQLTVLKELRLATPTRMSA